MIKNHSISTDNRKMLRVKKTKSLVNKIFTFLAICCLAFNTHVSAQQAGLHFDGSNDAVIISNAAPLQMNSGTLEAWIKTSNAGSSWRAIVVKALAYGLFLYDNQLVVYDWTLGSGLGNIYTGVNLADGNWHHVAVAFNNGVTNGSSVYVDGVSVRTYTQNIFAQTEVFAIGQSGNSGAYQSFQGTIDEVRIWNVRRTATEIADNRNCDVAQHTNLLAYYRFNEGTAAGTNTSIASAIDYSGNNYCGTLVNFAKTGSASNFVTGAIGTCNTIATGPAAITGTLTTTRGQTTDLDNSIAVGTWSSSNTTTATVNASTGVVYGMSPGTTTISYAAYCQTATTTLTVTANSGMVFDGTNDRIDGTNSLLPQGSSPRTIEAWINPSDVSSSRVIFNWGTFATGKRSGLILSGNRLYFVGESNDFNATLATVALNVWTHVAVSLTGQTVKFYVNGILVQTGTLPTMPNTTGGSWSISNTNDLLTTREPFSGKIDEIRVWNTVRTESEIASNMNCDVAQNANLVAYYRFDEGVAGGNNTAIARVTDYSGNNACGTIANMALTGSSSNFVTGAIGTCNTINTTPGAISGTLSMNRGASTTLANSTTGGTWSSSNTTIATVNASTGVVTGLFGGTCNITYTAYCNTVAATVTVNANAGMYFDGANDYVNIGTILTTNSSYTKEAWVYAKSHTGGNIISAGSHPFWIATGFLRSEQGTSIQDPNPFPLNSWVHVAATYDSATTTLKIYKNGLLVASSASAASYAAQTMNIGDYPVVHGNCFNGYIDDVRIWKTARTITQIQNDMNCDVAQAANLVAYYRFDEGVPAGTNTGISRAIDYSGNNNCGTFTNMALTGSVSNYAYGAINSCNTITVPSASPITGTLSLTRGQTSDLDNANAGGIWSSTNTTVATVDVSTGMITALAAGTTTISYTVFCNTITTAIVTVTAMAGLHFDGTNDYVNIGTPLPANSSYTKEAWIYAESVSGARNIVSSSSTPFWITGGTLAAGQNGNYTLVTSSGFPTSTWVHVAVTYDQPTATMKLYRNGTLVATNTSVATFPGDAMMIGSHLTGSIFLGTIDEVRIWNVARTQAEIQAGMNCDVATNGTLKAYYRFNEGSAGGTNTTITNAIDYSGNNNCGVLTNFAHTGSTSNYVTGSISSCNVITLNTPGTTTGTFTVSRLQTTDLDNSVPDGLWTSSNTSVATVNSVTGVVTGINTGTANISYSLFCNSAVVVVTVTANPGLNFDGSDDYISFNNDLSTVTNFTYEAWVRPYSNAGWARILDFGNAPGQNIFFTSSYAATGMPRFAINIGAGEQIVSSSQNLPLNIWSHLAVTLSGTTATIYMNGVIVGQNTSFSLNPSDLGATINNWIGKSQYADPYYHGDIDEVRIWNIARTQTQIQNNMNCDIDQDANLIAYYRFNEGIAAANNAGIAAATDYSGNGRCGTFNNFALNGATSNYATGAIGSCNTISLPTPGTTTGTLSVCEGLTTDLDNSVAGGQWSSSNTAVATVDETSGVVTAIAPGTTNIVYSLYCVPVTVVVTVNPNANAGTISGPSAVCVAASASLSTTGTGGVWSSSNTAKATVNSSGMTTGIESGLATISYVVVNSCGTDTATSAVTINPIPSAISGGLTVCPGSLTVLTNTPGGGTWSSPDATVNVNATNGKVTGVSPGTALISYTIPGGCAATTTVTVTPPPGSITGTLAVCPGGNATLVPDITGGTWSSSSPTKATINESTGEVSAISSGVAVITYTVGSGCYATVPFTVNPIAAAITGALTICPGTTSDLNSATTGGVWTSSNPAIATVNSSTGLVVSVAGPGTSTIQYTVVGLCPRTVTATIAASSPNTGTPVICLGQPTAVTPLSNATPGGLWTSSNPARIEVSPSTGVMNGLSIGTAVVTYSLNAGCFSTTVVSVTAAVNAITGVTNICPGNTTTLTCTTAGGTWSSSNSSIASTGTGPVVTGISAGIATITYQTSPGCYKTTNLTVNGAMADITGIDTVCIGATTTLSSGPAGGTWSSSNTARATINGTSGVATGISAGTTTITYRLGSSGCMTTKVITINPSVPVITGTANVCPGATATLLNAVAGGTWISSNTSRATIDASSGVVTGIAQGTSLVTYMTGPTCFRTTIQSVNAAPAAIGGPASVCVGNTITLSTSGSGAWSSTNTAAATISSAGVLRGIATGVTTVSYIITGTGCSNSVNISVNPVPANITGTLTACVGATTTLTSAPGGGIWSSSNAIKATVDASSGVVSALQVGTANIIYTLATGCNKTAIVSVSSLPAPINGMDTVCVGLTTALSTTTGGGTWISSNIAAATVNPTSGLVRGMDAGVSTISYRFTSGCSSVRQITVNSLPGTITGGTNICIGAPQTLASSGGGVWSSSNPSSATVDAGSGQVSGISAGTAHISYTLPTGCSRRTTVNINTSPALISGAASVNFGATTTLTCTPGGGSWSSFDADIASVIATNGIVTGVNEGTTTIMYQLANGCYSTTEISVTTPAGRQHIAGSQQNTARLFSITPNPTSGILNVATNETGMFVVFTMDGKMVSQTAIVGNTTQVVLPSDLATGMYLCKFTTTNGNTEMARIVLSH